MYGVSAGGGEHDNGAIFRYNLTDGTFKVLYSFQDQDIDGINPFTALAQGSDGNLYGACTSGFPPDQGSLEQGNGSYFQVTPGGSLLPW